MLFIHSNKKSALVNSMHKPENIKSEFIVRSTVPSSMSRYICKLSMEFVQ